MKFLRSQGIVLILVVIAVVLVGRNLIGPMLKSRSSGRSATRTSTPPTPPAAAASTPVAQATTAVVDTLKTALNTAASKLKPFERETKPRVEAINVQALREAAVQWISAPQRDPFKARGRVSEKRASEQLSLTGVLRQTDGELAVLNNQIIARGESILGFVLESVEGDRVWVSGPNGKEELFFKGVVAVPESRADDRRIPAPKSALVTPQAAGGNRSN